MNSSKKKSGERFLRFRHRVVKKILVCTVGIYGILRYRIRIKPLGEKKERQYLILFNHQTAFDQFFVGMVFKKPVYYLASEDLFSNGIGLTRNLISLDTIPLEKRSSDAR